jgi:hypothetical protein
VDREVFAAPVLDALTESALHDSDHDPDPDSDSEWRR